MKSIPPSANLIEALDSSLLSRVRTLVLAGGSGTRFWPASRRLRPKQLLPLGRNPNETLIEATLRRVAPLCPIEHALVSTGRHLVISTLEALPNLRPEQILAEPVARNTAPCMAWAAHHIARTRPNALIISLHSDHIIEDEEAFLSSLVTALPLADEGHIVTVGIEPTRPETGFGYIEVGDQITGSAHQVKRFVEKPDRARAEQFIATGNFLWNAGMFVFRADTMKAAIKKHLPDLAEILERIDAAAAQGDEASAVAHEFPRARSISIDHGVVEKFDKLAVVRGRFAWNDIGSWQSAWELSAHDEHGNSLSANAVTIDSKRNLLRDLRSSPTPRTVAFLGVDDLVVVETDDALLVLHRDKAQDIRLIVERLPPDKT